MQPDGTPKPFARLEYINTHRRKVHAALNLPAINPDKGNSHRMFHSHKQAARVSLEGIQATPSEVSDAEVVEVTTTSPPPIAGEFLL